MKLHHRTVKVVHDVYPCMLMCALFNFSMVQNNILSHSAWSFGCSATSDPNFEFKPVFCCRTSLSFRQIVQLFSPKDKTWNFLSKIKSRPNSISYFRFFLPKENFIILKYAKMIYMQNKMWLCGLWTDTILIKTPDFVEKYSFYAKWGNLHT